MKIFLPTARKFFSAVCRRGSAGFSLLEMSIVLLVMAVLGTMFLTAIIAKENNEKTTVTEERLHTVIHAIKRYRRANHRLPCPGDLSLTVASGNYGVEGATPGTCTGGTPAANFSTTNLVVGAVPVKTIGLSEDYMFDAWERKLTYVVDTRATDTCAFTTYPVSDTTLGFTVQDDGGNTRTDKAWFAVLSHGINGHGAYLHSGARYDANSTNSDEQLNCHCDDDAVDTGVSTTFVDRAVELNVTSMVDRYDDILRYMQRMHLTTLTEEQGGTDTCP